MARQTIMSVTLDKQPEGNFTDADWEVVTRNAYSIDGYSPVLVTIKIGTVLAVVHTTPLPDGLNAWWREPNAETRRRLLDHELFKRGMVRDGRMETPSADAWYHRYPIRAK